MRVLLNSLLDVWRIARDLLFRKRDAEAWDLTGIVIQDAQTEAKKESV